MNLFINNHIYYRDLSQFLREKDLSSKNFSESQLKSWTSCLYDEIKKFNNIKENTIVYRGIKLKFSPDIGIGSRFYFREFISTSLEERIPFLWAS